MKRTMVKLAVLSVAAFALTACEGQSPEAKRRTGQIAGGVTGAVVGSAFGGGTGRVIATGAGAVLGAVAGGEIADRMN